MAGYGNGGTGASCRGSERTRLMTEGTLQWERTGPGHGRMWTAGEPGHGKVCGCGSRHGRSRWQGWQWLLAVAVAVQGAGDSGAGAVVAQGTGGWGGKAPPPPPFYKGAGKPNSHGKVSLV